MVVPAGTYDAASHRLSTYSSAGECAVALSNVQQGMRDLVAAAPDNVRYQELHQAAHDAQCVPEQQGSNALSTIGTVVGIAQGLGLTQMQPAPVFVPVPTMQPLPPPPPVILAPERPTCCAGFPQQ